MIVIIFFIKIKSTFKILNSFLLSTFLSSKIKLQNKILSNIFFQFSFLTHRLDLPQLQLTLQDLSSKSTLSEAIYFPVLSSPKMNCKSKGFFIVQIYIYLSLQQLYINQSKKKMAFPYSHPFLKRQNTMYMSTLTQFESSSKKVFHRESSFLKNDIQGAKPRQLIPKKDKNVDYTLSTFVQQPPNAAKGINRKSNPLFVHDIQGARPKNKDFKTKRVVNPLDPHYILPSASAVQLDKGRTFIRDNLMTSDINTRKGAKSLSIRRPRMPSIEGASPAKQTKQVKAISRLNVKDINKPETFQSQRRTDPLVPQYVWRDNSERTLNRAYGHLQGAQPRKYYPILVNKKNDLSLNVKDIEGAQTGTKTSKSLFIDKRKQFRNYMLTKDIQRNEPSSLKKGMITLRHTNPLMPKYQYPGASQKK